MDIKINLDKRICDIVKGASNDQTFREFINEGIEEFELGVFNLDGLNDEELNILIEHIDCLWEK